MYHRWYKYTVICTTSDKNVLLFVPLLPRMYCYLHPFWHTYTIIYNTGGINALLFVSLMEYVAVNVLNITLLLQDTSKYPVNIWLSNLKIH